MRDLGVEAGLLGMRHGALRPLDALVVPRLVVEAAGVGDLELDAVLERARPVVARVEQAERAVEPLEPLLAAAEPLDGDADLAHQPRADDELAGRELERLRKRLLGLLVAREEHRDVTARLVDRDDLGRSRARATARPPRARARRAPRRRRSRTAPRARRPASTE